jgi:hypothetical protein
VQGKIPATYQEVKESSSEGKFSEIFYGLHYFNSIMVWRKDLNENVGYYNKTVLHFSSVTTHYTQSTVYRFAKNSPVIL